MAEAWYYSLNGERKGPVEAATLRTLAEQGVVSGETPVWREGLADWEPAFRHVPGLAPNAPPSPPSSTRIGGSAEPRGGRAFAPQGRDYEEQVGLAEAFRRFWRNYATFTGRSNRGEYWWATLSLLILGVVVGIIDVALFDTSAEWQPLSNLLTLATIVPGLALSARRLHDTDRSGWWLLIGLVPIVGWIILIVWYCQRPDPRPNRFG